MISVAQGFLACPVCLRPGIATKALFIGDKTATCANGHCFDIARQGFLNLLGSAQPRNADNAGMVAARGRVHQAGVFAPVAQALRQPTSDLCLSVDNPALEVGAGTAYYLREVVDPYGAAGIALDVSTAAARAAAQASPLIASVVADVWQALPICDQSVGLILCVFAPRNLAEFARALHPEGRLIVVTPNSGHLAALRSRDELLDIAEHKEKQLESGPFRITDSQTVRYPVALDAELASDVIAMGPNAFHPTSHPAASIEDHVDITVHMLERKAG
ncbi:MAG: methyltransferase domain-containing protein [Propionibacteriaceae bacterium]|nr:methyltransferase domain-containing protein [Propionibacteriaceae bacterium]